METYEGGINLVIKSSKKANISQNAFLLVSHIPSNTFLRLPDLLWLRHVAQFGAPAPTPGPFKQQRHHQGTQQDQQGEAGWHGCSRKRPGVFQLPRKDQPVLKFTSSFTDCVRRQMHKKSKKAQSSHAAPVYTASPCVPRRQRQYSVSAATWWGAAISLWWKTHPVGHFALYVQHGGRIERTGNTLESDVHFL